MIELFRQVFEAEGERIYEIIRVLCFVVAFTLILSVVITKFFIRRAENDAWGAISFVLLIVVGIWAFPVLQSVLFKASKEIDHVVNPSGQNGIVEYYDKVRVASAEAAAKNDGGMLDGIAAFVGSLNPIKGATESFRDTINAFIFQFCSYVNKWLIKTADKIVAVLQGLLALFAPLVIAAGLLPPFKEKTVGFVSFAVQVAVWPIGWSIGTATAKFFVLGKTMTQEIQPILLPSEIISTCILLILWTILYLLFTPFVVRSLIGNGRGGGGLLSFVASSLHTASHIVALMPGKGTAAAAAMRGGAAGISAAGGGGASPPPFPVGGGGGGSLALAPRGGSGSLAPITRQAVSRGGIIVPHRRHQPLAIETSQGKPIIIDV